MGQKSEIKVTNTFFFDKSKGQKGANRTDPENCCHSCEFKFEFIGPTFSLELIIFLIEISLPYFFFDKFVYLKMFS